MEMAFSAKNSVINCRHFLASRKNESRLLVLVNYLHSKSNIVKKSLWNILDFHLDVTLDETKSLSNLIKVHLL